MKLLSHPEQHVTKSHGAQLMSQVQVMLNSVLHKTCRTHQLMHQFLLPKGEEGMQLEDLNVSAKKKLSGFWTASKAQQSRTGE